MPGVYPDRTVLSAQKPPVAIRITRPYQTEEEFLGKELDTISRAGITLVGAQQRPEGFMLRFELALASGAPLLRGEGRVVGYKNQVVGSEPGLSLRFTRLDSKSKAFVDRVVALRETRRSSAPPQARSAPPPPVVAAAPPPPPPPPPPRPVEIARGSPEREALLGRLRERRVDATQILQAGAERRRHT